MSIKSIDEYIASTKQILSFNKPTSTTVNPCIATSFSGRAGHPGIVTSTGLSAPWIITDAAVGFPKIVDIGKPLYLTRVSFIGQFVKRLDLYDCLTMSGPHSSLTATTNVITGLVTSRFPVVNSVTDYTCGIWLEMTASSGVTFDVQVSYVNQDDVTRTTPVITVSAAVRNSAFGMVKLPLFGTDTGVKRVLNVYTGGATGATFNILMLRYLWSSLANSTAGQLNSDVVNTGMPQVFPDSAIFPIAYSNGSSSGTCPITIEVSG